MTRLVAYHLRAANDKVLTPALDRHNVPSLLNGGDMQKFIGYMTARKFSPQTIHDRVEFLGRLAGFLPGTLLEATSESLEGFQATYAHLAPASVDIYTRHIRAFYRWARRAGLIETDPAEDLPLPIVPKAIPHPTSFDDLRVILGCSTGILHTSYVLAAFAGLRAGEICRLAGREINRDSGKPIALIHGKGNKDRMVPILAPVMSEIGFGRGWIITKNDKPVRPSILSAESSRFIKSLGIGTTLHSMRATFATHVMRLTGDPLLVRDLLGHESLETTQIYTLGDMANVHTRIADFAAIADELLNPRRLAAVGS